jgi:hypothetical protein
MLNTGTSRARRAAAWAMLAIMAAGACAGSAQAQSLGDRFKSLFGGNSQPADAPPAASTATPDVPDCPAVSIRPGASTFAIGLPGKQAVGSDLRYQATITRTARDCTLSGGQVIARIGIQGRVIVGPAGAPASVVVPLRVAVVEEGVTPKTIATKVFRTTVEMGDTSVPFSLVGEDIVYPAPQGASGDNYVFYIGFDPQALGPEPRAKKKRSQ